MARPRKSVVLARELVAAPPKRLRKRFITRFVLLRLCELASEKMSSSDGDGLRLAQLCCRIAGQLKSAEATALSFGRLATALRQAQRLGHAEQALAIALSAAPEDLVGDLLRRRAWICMYRDRMSEAVADARGAVRKTRGQAKAKSHEVLGIALCSLGDHDEGLRELELCLATTDPDAETAYCNAVLNYATGLSRGTDLQAIEALALLAELRQKLKDRHKLQRAKLWWTVGLIHERLDSDTQAWRALDTARRSLIAMTATSEVAAITADMARLGPRSPALRLICGEATALIRAPHPLSQLLDDLEAARHDAIPDAAGALRGAAGELAACPPPHVAAASCSGLGGAAPSSSLGA